MQTVVKAGSSKSLVLEMPLAPTNSMTKIRSKDGRYTAEFLPYSHNWMVGAIQGTSFVNSEARETLARDVMSSIENVSDAERAYSTCTDGRRRVCLELGPDAAIPVREQTVGTDTMMAFVAAEALGERFYDRDQELYSSVSARLRKVVDFMIANGMKPTAHIGCGAAGGFTGVMSRATQFINSADYTARLQAVMPNGTYDSVLHRFIVGGYRSRLDSNVYEGYYDGLVTEIIREKVGLEAVECYLDDSRGVRGHCEVAIAYLDDTILGCALNPNALADKAGVQVFAVNTGRMRDMARLMSHASDRDSERKHSSRMDYITALIAMHDFAAAGHGTLANGMETMIIRSLR